MHAYRKDIADIALAGQLIAPHYARPMFRPVRAEVSLRACGSAEAEVVAVMASGEEFAVLETAGDWAWGYRRTDHLVGYIPADSLPPSS